MANILHWMSRKKKPEASATAGMRPQESMPDKRLKCFRDIKDIVLGLNDEEWTALTKDLPNKYTRLDFAVLCTKIVRDVSTSAVQGILPTLIDTVGKEKFRLTAAKFKQRAEGRVTTAARSEEDPLDLICNIIEGVVIEIKNAMKNAILKVASDWMQPSQSGLHSPSLGQLSHRLDKTDSHSRMMADVDSYTEEVTPDHFHQICTNSVCDVLQKWMDSSSMSATSSMPQSSVLTPDIACSSAVPETSTDLVVEISISEDGTITEKPFSGVETDKPAEVHVDTVRNQLKNLMSDEAIQRHAKEITALTSKIFRNMIGPNLGRSFSDSALEMVFAHTSLLREPSLSPLVNIFLDESMQHLLQHLLSVKPTLTDMALQSTSCDKDKLSGFQALSNFSKTLRNFVVKCFHTKSSRSGKRENVEPEQMDSNTIRHILTSAKPSSRIPSVLSSETLDDPGTSNQKRQSHDLNFSSLDEVSAPAGVKRRTGFHFIVGKKAPLIRVQTKKQRKVCPIYKMTDHNQPTSSGSLHGDSCSEPKASESSSFQSLHRMFSAICTTLRLKKTNRKK
ncbi:hypothetical protein PHYPO_G00107590 [Pangasianodon hypophthalmus]|uniref:Uncharacterized protein n=1 Tax=Pangasianodon hypophthalmus TaxID=310915 RepID=A0A5N5PZ57_PANHP|nr:hypothetical protein PHYPO_G00107590 [Pangasianodon hypophthalmus]